MLPHDCPQSLLRPHRRRLHARHQRRDVQPPPLLRRRGSLCALPPRTLQRSRVLRLLPLDRGVELPAGRRKPLLKLRSQTLLLPAVSEQLVHLMGVAGLKPLHLLCGGGKRGRG